jgi:hypothetical protein
MSSTTAISNPYANWAAIVDARAIRLAALTEYLERYQGDWRPGSADYELHRQLIARAAFSTWLDEQTLPAAPDPQPLPRLHQVLGVES